MPVILGEHIYAPLRCGVARQFYVFSPVFPPPMQFSLPYNASCVVTTFRCACAWMGFLCVDSSVWHKLASNLKFACLLWPVSAGATGVHATLCSALPQCINSVRAPLCCPGLFPFVRCFCFVLSR